MVWLDPYHSNLRKLVVMASSVWGRDVVRGGLRSGNGPDMDWVPHDVMIILLLLLHYYYGYELTS